MIFDWYIVFLNHFWWIHHGGLQLDLVPLKTSNKHTIRIWSSSSSVRDRNRIYSHHFPSDLLFIHLFLLSINLILELIHQETRDENRRLKQQYIFISLFSSWRAFILRIERIHFIHTIFRERKSIAWLWRVEWDL